MKHALLLLLLIVPLASAHDSSQEDVQTRLSSDGAYASTNSFQGVNPFVQASQGNWGQAVFAAVIWAGLIGGLWQLLKMVLGRILIIRE